MTAPITGPTLNVATLNGSYSSPSKTQGLIDLILAQLGEHYTTEVTSINVTDLGPGFTGALSRDDLDPASLAAMEAVERADLVIAASPVYRGSYSGLFKHFIDLIDQYALANKPVILAATGGSDRHTLMIDHELRPLFAFLQAHVSPTGIYASSGDFAGQLILNPQIHARVELAVSDLAPVIAAQLAGRSTTPGQTQEAGARL